MKDRLLDELVIFLRAFVDDVMPAIIALLLYRYLGLLSFVVYIISIMIMNWIKWRRDFYEKS